MAVFLVDYENVQGTGGLWGVEALTPRDSLYIFYSSACPTIYRRDAEFIERSGCEFHTVFLPAPGKNALDFMIVSQLGIFAERGYKNIAIVSMDNGFKVARDFVNNSKISGLNDMHVVVVGTIESGIRQLPEESEIGWDRHRKCIWEATRIELKSFHDEHLKKQQIQKIVETSFCETPHFPIIEKISWYAMECLNMKSGNERYRSALRTFGSKNGLDIYQRLKPMMDEFCKQKEEINTNVIEKMEESPLQRKLKAALESSPLHSSFEEIYNLACKLLKQKNKEERFHLCQKNFGNIVGQEVYRILKPILATVA